MALINFCVLPSAAQTPRFVIARRPQADVAISQYHVGYHESSGENVTAFPRLHPKGTFSRFALRAPRPLWGLAMTIRNPCMFGDAAQQPVTAKGAYSP